MSKPNQSRSENDFLPILLYGHSIPTVLSYQVQYEYS